ncbi:hypothetical protein TNCV_3895941 [Trichonephila clavipes]|nr:hypothetical protein TNCV_3895941 [Trichonephila clavipes]
MRKRNKLSFRQGNGDKGRLVARVGKCLNGGAFPTFTLWRDSLYIVNRITYKFLGRTYYCPLYQVSNWIISIAQGYILKDLRVLFDPKRCARFLTVLIRRNAAISGQGGSYRNYQKRRDPPASPISISAVTDRDEFLDNYLLKQEENYKSFIQSWEEVVNKQHEHLHACDEILAAVLSQEDRSKKVF